MRYIKLFEETNEDVKNKIFIVDISGPFLYDLKRCITITNFYLADKFTCIFCDHIIEFVDNEMTLDKLIKEVINGKHLRGGGGDGMQDAIDYIIDQKLKGPVLIFTDGVISIDVTELENDIAILSIADKPRVRGNYQLFYDDLESYEEFYKPRDITPEQFELNKMAHKYNL
jgi:hypothetical protein